MTSLNTCLKLKTQAQAGGANRAVTKKRRLNAEIEDSLYRRIKGRSCLQG
jgi:hypothetical protein